MGSDSDFPVVRKAAEALKEFGIPFEMRVLSAHRSPKEVAEFAQNARANGFGVIIAAAGMAAHLAGAIAGNTTLPVIAIPVKAKALEGVDALLSSVMMPPGVPVATVGCKRRLPRCGDPRGKRRFHRGKAACFQEEAEREEPRR